MKRLIFILVILLFIGVSWWAVGDFMDKTENIRERSSENAKVQGNRGEKLTSKMLGWLGIAHGGDPNKPETWDVINGIKVPPMPDEKENNKTIGGIDINNNGVRDDVERAIVLEFGKEPDIYVHAMESSSAERNAMITQKIEHQKEYMKIVSCFMAQDYRKPKEEIDVNRKKRTAIIQRLDEITKLQLNTKIRADSYVSSGMLQPLRKGCYIDKNGNNFTGE